MSDTERAVQALEREERSMGRGCDLLDEATLFDGRLLVIVYSYQADTATGTMTTVRYAVYDERLYHAIVSGIIDSETTP